MSRRGLAAADYCAGVLGGQRRLVAKTITLLESRRDDDRFLGQHVLDMLVPHAGGAVRAGITGPPGVGKSSFIETLGLELVGQSQRVAVLAVDPSSPVRGGSILGDKTRMERLAREENAFIRPSPSGGILGGVAHRTREAMLVCEAAGFDVVIVETVGVGQSEVEVRSMVDFFAVLLQPGAGDDLQGIKKGVLELADALVVNKADGENVPLAERARVDYEHALQLLRSAGGWRTPVLTTSALRGDGISEFWETVLAHRKCLTSSGELDLRRQSQAKAWLWRLVEEGLDHAFRSDLRVAERIEDLEREVVAHSMTAPHAAGLLLEAFMGRSGRNPG
jgi:LAO/AO transport system kinase